MREQHFEQINKKIWDLLSSVYDVKEGIQRRDRDDLERMLTSVQASGIDLRAYIEAACFEEHPQAAKKMYKRIHLGDNEITSSTYLTTDPGAMPRQILSNPDLSAMRERGLPTTGINLQGVTGGIRLTDTNGNDVTAEGDHIWDEEQRMMVRRSPEPEDEVEIQQNSATEVQF